ncbi:uncharacterized protein BO97DRAFT_383308 [Aspergillus homomorphus CBS 101889]|uniref:NACHT domain-containing protein n=1 Tax=Aspergillus homomorphus (strain CBS 101889) TaxID=1450537 RepID=A0A395IC08_ASPHC|nr:hypothetical protein BO97DRAFT_383308 [Aspergillus homomorphus CBS 101889]RAL16628.1 hypothetical protein BO97DRAFT_383308 [Aspergillus homomorphus CBS 101889]
MAQPDHFNYLWSQAKARYKSVTGHDLDSPAFPRPASADELLTLLDSRNTAFQTFREKRSALFDKLSALCQPIEVVANVVSTGVAVVFPPSSACFAAIMLLIDAARGVSSLYDSIIGLFETLKVCDRFDFLSRLKIYIANQVTPELRTTLVSILVILLEIFGRSASVIRSGVLGRALTFTKNALLGRDEKLQSLLSQLEKLCQSENRLVVAETWAETKRTAHLMDQLGDDVGSLVIGQDAFRNEFQQEMLKMRDAVGSAKGERLMSIRNILKPSVNPLDMYQSIAKRRVPGTAGWILEELSFRKWVLDCQNQLLFVSGSPGSGKSVLCQHIISYLENLQVTAEDKDGSIGYFFFSNSDTETKSFHQALRDCAYQIYQADASYKVYLDNHLSSPDEIKTTRSAWRLLFHQYNGMSETGFNKLMLVFDGIDEAFQTDREEFFELISDLPSATGPQLKILMVGRPEIHGDLTQAVGPVPCIQVDAAKNSADIRTFIEKSMQTSQIFNRIPNELASSIQGKLIEKSQGMFLWADLMLRELSRKTRASSMLNSLKSAPKGLDEVLEHVLRGFSSKLDPEEAENLNTLLAWFACSDVPLTLRQLDFILQYDSAGGDGVFGLETMLRVQYASFFLLLREDGLTTADLQGNKAAAYVLEGQTDNDTTEFQSNKEMTRVVFRHASIGEYFRNREYGKVSDGPGCVPIGVNIVEAQTHILTCCLRLFAEQFGEDREGRVSLIFHTQAHWLSYMRQLVSNNRIDPQGKAKMGVLLCRLLSHPDTTHCLYPTDWELFASGDFRVIESFFADPAISIFDDDNEATKWLASCREKPGGLFLDLAKYAAHCWLGESIWSASECFRVVWAVKIISEDGNVEVVRETPSTKTVLEVAHWTRLEEHALWHERVGACLSDFGHLNEAKYHIDTALSLQPESVEASLDMARIYLKQNKRSEAIKIYREIEQLYTQSLIAQQEPDHEDSDLDMIVSPPRLARMRLILSELYLEENDCMEAAQWLDSSVQLGAYTIKMPRIVGRLFRRLGRAPYNDQAEIMRLLRSLDRKIQDQENTILDYCLIAHKWADGRFFDVCATAARATEALEWLVDRYLQAKASSIRNLRSEVAICLDICLARLYSRFMGQTGKAIAIWRQVMTLPRVEVDDHWEMTRSREITESSYAYQLYVDTLESPHKSNHFLSEVGTLSKWLFEVPLNRETFVANQAGLYLGLWHMKNGDIEQAKRYFKPYIVISLARITSMEPEWRADAFYKLATLLATAGDDANAVVVFHASRDAPDSSWDSLTPLSTPPGPWTWYCDICKQEYDSSAPCNKCRVCTADLCGGCFTSVQQATTSNRGCASNHDWLVIPSPTDVHEEGYVIKDGAQRSVDDFLRELREAWD